MDLLSQFSIKTYIPIYVFGINFSITNATVFMLLAVVSFCVITHYAISSQRIIPSYFQSSIEIFYQFLTDTIETFCDKETLKFYPYLLAIFSFIFFANMLGVVPGFFTTTSQIIVTLTIASLVFISVTIVGIIKHGFHFLRLFLPENIPWYIAILLVPVEIISYFFRPISLGVRLFANMVAGHVLIKVFATFAMFTVGTYFLPLSIIPVTINVLIMFFEVAVVFLQAYVFTILSCIYLKDALYLH